MISFVAKLNGGTKFCSGCALAFRCTVAVLLYSGIQRQAAEGHESLCDGALGPRPRRTYRPQGTLHAALAATQNFCQPDENIEKELLSDNV